MGFLDWPPSALQVFLLISLPVMGVVYALLGGVKLALAEKLGLDEAKVGKLVAGFGMMVGPTILACGFLTDAFGRKVVFIPGAALVTVAVVLLALPKTYGHALLAVALLGAGWSATINVANPLQYAAVKPEKLTQALNFFDFIFGFGALATPVVLAFLFKRLGYTRGLMALSVVAFSQVILGFTVTMGGGGGASPSDLGRLFTDRTFWVVSLAFLFYVPLESSVAGWATTLVTRHAPKDAPAESTQRLAALALSGFWFGFTGSRLIVSLLGVERVKHLMILGLSIAALAVVLGIVFLRGRGVQATLVVAAGFLFGPIFPTLIGLMLFDVPSNLQGRAVGFFFAFGSVGWTFIPSLIGSVARRTDNIQRGFLVAAASGLVSVVFVAAWFAGPRWEPLFDGHSLAGWEQKNGTATYRAEGGAIVGQTSEGSPNSFLCTKRPYGDFDLRFEVKVADDLNSGVQIRSHSSPEKDNGRVHGPQVEIAVNGTAGFIYGEGLKGVGWVSEPKAHEAFKKGEWNSYRVRAEGKRIRTWVNEVPVADLVDEKTGMASGFIGLQVHGIKPGTGPYEVRWKNLYVRDRR